jgi:hypothetical protein
MGSKKTFELLGPSERIILEILWRDGPCSIAQIMQQHPAAYMTVRTTMDVFCMPRSNGCSPSWGRRRPTARILWRRCVDDLDQRIEPRAVHTALRGVGQDNGLRTRTGQSRLGRRVDPQIARALS